MHYREWWKTFDAKEYLAGLAEEGVEGAAEKLASLVAAQKEGFEPVKFTVLTEAWRGIRVTVEGVEALIELDRFEYDTRRHGPGHSFISVVLCKDTGKKDAHDRNIYRSHSGELFVVDKQGGTPEAFGHCDLVSPVL